MLEAFYILIRTILPWRRHIWAHVSWWKTILFFVKFECFSFTSCLKLSNSLTQYSQLFVYLFSRQPTWMMLRNSQNTSNISRCWLVKSFVWNKKMQEYPGIAFFEKNVFWLILLSRTVELRYELKFQFIRLKNGCIDRFFKKFYG